MSNYCTYAQIEPHLLNSDADVDKAPIEALLAAASREIDKMCGVAPNYFAVAAQNASSKTFYGSGTRWLRVPPYTGSITANDVDYVTSSLTVPTFTVRGNDEVTNHKLVAINECWACDEQITISARWGFSAIPAEIVQATVEMVIALYRTTDPAKERAVADATGEVARMAKIPMRVKDICERWQKLQPVYFG